MPNPADPNQAASYTVNLPDFWVQYNQRQQLQPQARPQSVNLSALGGTGGMDLYAGSSGGRPQSVNLSALGATGAPAVDPYANLNVGLRPQSVNLSAGLAGQDPMAAYAGANANAGRPQSVNLSALGATVLSGTIDLSKPQEHAPTPAAPVATPAPATNGSAVR